MSRYLQQGSVGPDVLEVETKLTEQGYVVGTVDVVFDEKTDAAVRYFQLLNSLEVDGIVGPITRAALGIPETELPPGGGETVPGSGGGDVEFGVRIVSMECGLAMTTYRAEAYGQGGGSGVDTLFFLPEDSGEEATEYVQVQFEVGPHGSYERQVPTPAATAAAVVEAARVMGGARMRVTLRVNAEATVGSDERTEWVTVETAPIPDATAAPPGDAETMQTIG